MSLFSRETELSAHPIFKGLPVEDITRHAESIEAMVSKYSTGLDGNNDSPSSHKPRTVNETVLLTGSTGNLGCYILASLLLIPNVQRVYTFNRRSATQNILERHRAHFAEKGLDVALLSSPKLVHLEGDIALPSLDLQEGAIITLQRDVTSIIHTAWSLSFSLPLSSFEGHIQGTRTLIDIARSSERRDEIRFLFTASIAMTQNWNESQGPYPETLVMDTMTAVGGGYGESKYVAERILAKSGLQVTSLRIGQICGGESNGAWEPTEWFPMLIKACWYLGAIFIPRQDFKCMTMDAISDIVLDIVFHKDLLPFAANLTHPRPVTSAYIFYTTRDAVIQEFGHENSSGIFREVSFEEWMNLLQQSASRHNAEPRNITRLLSKIIGKIPPAVTLDISNAIKLSERMRTLEPIGAGLVLKWVKYWIASGYLGQESGFREDMLKSHL
ncbi:male sterility protein-domain-containing protein [Lentinula raphanica]|nr:male sterility protein-domain-containing protein [Lentinula raphanica]